MNAQRPLTPLERDRAIGRLRQLTLGTALVGVAAVAGIGSVAAITFPGHSSGVAATTDATGAVSAATGSSTSISTIFAAPTIGPSRSSGGAQVVTGGS